MVVFCAGLWEVYVGGGGRGRGLSPILVRALLRFEIP